MEIQSKMIHSEGYCGIVKAVESNSFLTIGSDTRVLSNKIVNNKFDSQELPSVAYEPVACTSSVSLKRCYIACSDNIIRSYELDSFVVREVVGKMTQAITSIAVSNNSKWLYNKYHNKSLFSAVASKDSKIDVIEIEKREVAFSLIGNQGGVCFVAFDPLSEFVCSLGIDQTLRIWNIASKKCVASKPYLNKDYITRLSCSWTANGDYLAVPTNLRIDIIHRHSWDTYTLIDSGCSTPIELVSISPNGAYIAFICCDDNNVYWLIVKDIKAKEDVNRMMLETDQFNVLNWCDDGRSLLLLDKGVHLSKFESMIPAGMVNGVDEVVTQSLLTSPVVTPIQTADVAPVTRLPASVRRVAVDSDDEMPVVLRSRYNTSVEEEKEKEEERDMMNVDEVGISTEDPYADYRPDAASLVDTSLHSQFMPASTELIQDRCFLAWNETGLIVKRFDGGMSSIEIEFTDGQRKRHLFTEDYDVTVASLSPAGAVMGGVREDESGKMTGILYYRAFTSWTAHAFWRVELSHGEVPQLVACTDTMVFVYTSKGYLRTWSTSGVQGSILTPCGHVVCIVGNEGKLAIIYEDSYIIDETPNLKVLIYSTSPFRRIHQGPLPLSRKSQLKWVGFSKEGLFSTYDSQCVIRVICGIMVPSEVMRSDDMEWIVLMNMRHAMKEKQLRGEALPYCWLIALSVKTIKYIYLPSAASSPPTLPRPLQAVMDVTLPLCNKNNANITFENAMLLKTYELSSMTLSPAWEANSKRELVEFDKMLLRQINTELGSNQLMHAEYLCSLINTVAAMKKAYILAQKANISQLMESIDIMITEKSNDDNTNTSYTTESNTSRMSLEDKLNTIQSVNVKRSYDGDYYEGGDPKKVITEDRVKSPVKPENVFRKTYESPVKKSLVGQLRSIVSPKKN